jgi:hypothetical protein
VRGAASRAKSIDHGRDIMPDDFTESPAVVIPPEFVQLGSLLESMTTESRLVLLSSASPNGFPWWMAKWEERMGWTSFLIVCREVFEAIDAGRPADVALYERCESVTY